MMERGVSCIVSSCSAELHPSIMRALGTTVAEGGREVTVFLARSQSRQLLQDIRDTGRLAVVFSEPYSHRSVQLKARSARIRSAHEGDVPSLQRYVASMEHELERIGIAPRLTRAMLSQQLDDLAAVSFVPEEAFDQTPGPRAGSALGADAARTT
jgi:hypothetical protein